MKLAFSALALVCMVQAAIAQKELPAFGKIDLTDMELKDCPFDPGAVAYKLIDWCNIYFTKNPDDPAIFRIRYERRLRIKILKGPGLSYANLTIPFYSTNNNERIVRMEACTYNLTDGSKIKKTAVHKEAIYSRQVDKQRSEMIVVFPEVKAGSVIEYRYVLERKTIADIKDWFFQDEIPTRYSECQLSIPATFHLMIQPLVADSLETKEFTRMESQSGKSGSVGGTLMQKNFIMHNLPAIRTEPYMSTAKDYLQRLSFHLTSIDYGNGNIVDTPGDWDEVADELMADADFGKQIIKQFTLPAAVITGIRDLRGLENRMRFIYNYVKTNMDWDGREEIYSYEGTKKMFQKRSGSSADINLLLISLLNQAGVSALPVLFSTRDNGIVNTRAPFVKQFNTVMAFVKLAEDKEKYYILDATDKYAAYYLVPEKIINTKGLVVEPGNTRWLEAIDTIHKYKIMTAISGEIDSLGIMKGEALTNSSGYARKHPYQQWAQNKNKPVQEKFQGEYTGLQVDGDHVQYPEADSLPFEHRLRFSIPLDTTGEHRYFKVNLFSGMEQNPFLASERRTDIDFCYQQEYIIYGSYTIPADYVFEELPQDISLIMPDTSIVFKRFMNADNNSLNVRITVDFRRPWYAAGEYRVFADFYKSLISTLNEQVIIKKKD